VRDRDGRRPVGQLEDAPQSLLNAGVVNSPFLTTAEVADQLRCSLRTVHELTRTNSIPHRKMPGTRRCLYIQVELDEWVDGAPLDVEELPRGGRVVRPLPPS
jgi:excisionase family DNA binding protein